MHPQPSSSRDMPDIFSFNAPPSQGTSSAITYANMAPQRTIPPASNNFPRPVAPHPSHSNVNPILMAHLLPPRNIPYAQAPPRPPSHTQPPPPGLQALPHEESRTGKKVRLGIQNLNTDYQDLEREHNEKISRLYSDIEVKNTELQKVRRMNQHLQNKIDETESAQKELANSKAQNSDLIKEMKHQKRMIKEKDAALKNLTSHCQISEQRALDCANAKGEVESRLQVMTTTLEESEARNEELVKEVDNKEKQITKLENDKKNLELKLSVEKLRNDQSKVEAERVQEKNTMLEKTLKEKKKEIKILRNLIKDEFTVLEERKKRLSNVKDFIHLDSDEEELHEISTENGMGIEVENEGECRLSIAEDLSSSEKDGANNQPLGLDDDEGDEPRDLVIDEMPVYKRRKTFDDSWSE